LISVNSLPVSLSIIFTIKPGDGLVAEPALNGNVCKFLKLQEIIQPDSVYQ